MKFKVTIIVCVLALLGGFCPVDRSLAAEPYHLGVNLAITGTGALYCKDGVDAIELAVKEINDQGGFLGKPYDTEGIARAIINLLSDTHLYQAKQKAILERVKKYLDVKLMVDEYEKLYEEIIS